MGWDDGHRNLLTTRLPPSLAELARGARRGRRAGNLKALGEGAPASGRFDYPTREERGRHTLARESYDLAPTEEAVQLEKRIKKFVLIGIILLVVAVISTLVVAGMEPLWFSVSMLTMGGIGVFRGIQLLRKPELISREEPGPRYDEIIAHDGIDLDAVGRGATPGETRLAVQNALDSFSYRRAFLRLGVPVAVVAGLGTLGWIVGAIVSMVVGQDFASTALCLVGAAGFGALTLGLTRFERRLRTAERVLEKQLLSLEARTVEVPDANPIPSGGGESRRWT